MDHLFFFFFGWRKQRGEASLENRSVTMPGLSAEFVNSQKEHFRYEVSCLTATGEGQRARWKHPRSQPASPHSCVAPHGWRGKSCLWLTPTTAHNVSPGSFSFLSAAHAPQQGAAYRMENLLSHQPGLGASTALPSSAKSLNLSVLQVLHLKNGDIIYLSL